jgi:hypothetical protein
VLWLLHPPSPWKMEVFTGEDLRIVEIQVHSFRIFYNRISAQTLCSTGITQMIVCYLCTHKVHPVVVVYKDNYSLKLIDPHDSLLVCFEHMLSSIPPIHDICQCLHHHQHSIFPTMLWLVQFCSPMYRPQHCTHQC